MKSREILEALTTGSLLPVESLRFIDPEAVADERERPAFDLGWITAFDVVEKAWRLRQSQDTEHLSRIREIAFKRAFAATSSHDLAAMISDDFDLISRSHEMDLQIPFIDSLLHAYSSGKIPK
jgi:hypothetical protein